MNLVTALLYAPWTGLDPKRPDVFHAITFEELSKAWPFPPKRVLWATGACGAKHLKIAADTEENGVPWPPRVKTMPTRFVRCRACHEATGRKRPRSSFIPKDAP